jgi:hypothetical protein
MTLLSEFPKAVVDSHALVAAEVMSGFKPSADTLLELAAESITVDRLTVLMARQAGSIQLAHDCWAAACECFETSHDLWGRLSHDDLLTGHRRLLERLVRSSQERREFYPVTDHDRAVYNAQRDHGMPCALPE